MEMVLDVQPRQRAEMKVRVLSGLDAEDRARLDAFAAETPVACYLQDADWPEYAPRKKRHTYAHVVAEENGRILAAGVLRRTRLAGRLFAAAFRRGPLSRTPEDLAAALPAIRRTLLRRGAVSLTLNPRWTGAEADRMGRLLVLHGARRLPFERQTLHVETGLIDLGKPPEEIRQGWSQSVRRHLKRLARDGYTARPVDGPEVEALHAEWLGRLSDKRDFDISGLPTSAQQFAHCRAKGGVIAGAFHGEELIGVFTGLRDADRILFMAGGWKDPDLKIPRISLMVDHLTSEAMKLPGAARIDLGGLTPEAERLKDPAAEGRDRGKLAFRPRVETLLSVHEFSLLPGAEQLLSLARRAKAARD